VAVPGTGRGQRPGRAGDGAHVLVFQSAAILGAPELLPLLRNYEPGDPYIRDALDACDPAARTHRDQFAWALLTVLHDRSPGIDAALTARRHEAGTGLTVAAEGRSRTWHVDTLSARANGDPGRAAALVAADLREPGAVP